MCIYNGWQIHGSTAQNSLTTLQRLKKFWQIIKIGLDILGLNFKNKSAVNLFLPIVMELKIKGHLTARIRTIFKFKGEVKAKSYFYIWNFYFSLLWLVVLINENLPIWNPPPP